MSIMEKNLPIAESLGEGDKVRIVTSEGNSKQIDASEIGGGSALLVIDTYDGSTGDEVLDKTWQELHDAYVSGQRVIVQMNYINSASQYEYEMYIEMNGVTSMVNSEDSSDCNYSVYTGNGHTLSCTDKDDYPRIYG